MDRDAAITLGTATSFWLGQIPRLRSYRYLVTKNSPQNKSLSPRVARLSPGKAAGAALARRP